MPIILVVGIVSFSADVRGLFLTREQAKVNNEGSTFLNSPQFIDSPNAKVDYNTSIDGVKDLKQRYLSKKQKEIILAKISRIKDVKIVIFSNHSGESFEYQEQFEEIFRQAGWIVEHFSPEQLRKPHDLLIGKNSENPNSKAFDYLKEAMEASDIVFKDGEFTTDADHELSFDAGVLALEPIQEALDKSLYPF